MLLLLLGFKKKKIMLWVFIFISFMEITSDITQKWSRKDGAGFGVKDPASKLRFAAYQMCCLRQVN